MVTYELSDGRLVQIPYDVCHATFMIAFTLEDGSRTYAMLVPGREAEITAAYRAWQNR